jgi:hypothetical protein
MRWALLVAACLALLLKGIRDRAGAPTPPLERAAGGPLRARELATLAGTHDGVALKPVEGGD